MSQEMFEQDAQYLWADMLGEARSNGQDDLIAWLERARPVSFDGAVMRLVTKQKWAARNLMGKYREAVEALMAEITMEPVTLEVEVEGGAEVPTAAGAAIPRPGSTSMTSPAGAPAPQAPATPAVAPATPEASEIPGITACAAPSAGAEAGDLHVAPGTTAMPPAGMQAMPQEATPPAAPYSAVEGTAKATTTVAATTAETVAEPNQGVSEIPTPQAQQPISPLSAAALAGKMATTGRPRIHSRILSGEVPMPTPTARPVSTVQGQSQTPAHRYQPPVSTTVENSANACAGSAPVTQPIPVLEEGVEQKDEVKAQSSSDFTFDTYVVGDSNQIAYRLAMNVAEQPDGSLFNPLFIWGPSGNGKTHLLLAIQSYIALHQPRVRVQYVSAQMFINQYVEEVQVRKLRGNDVLRSMRNVDVLLLDDIQLFKQKMESVTALFEIFNNFILAGNKQIVLAADRAPDYLDLDPRLTTRFSQGMVADIQAPTWEMKLSILKSLYERYRARNGIAGVRISDANFEVIAQHCPDNPRQMTGLVNSIMMRAEFDPNLLTPEGIRAYIDSQFNVETEISLDKIIDAVTKEYGVSYEQITSRSRTKDIKEARQVYMWLANQLTDETYQSIGDVVGLNHATITHGIKVINEKRNADHGYARQLEDFKNRLCNESK